MKVESDLTGPLVEKGLVKAHSLAAMFFMLTAMTGGFLISMQFYNHYAFEGISWLSYGRVRLLHTNEIAYGFIFNGFLGLLYYAIPRLTGKRVFNATLGWAIFWIWQFIVLLVLEAVMERIGKLHLSSLLLLPLPSTMTLLLPSST